MPEVDAKLVRLCLDRELPLLTLDTNLAKAASLAGVRVLNLHALALALRPPVVAGDDVDVLLHRAGKEPGQAVGYLDDGTMVVVEHGRDRIGAEVAVRVTSVLTTANGRMVFAQPPNPVRRSRSPRREIERSPTPAARRVSSVVTVAAVVPAAGRGERLGPGGAQGAAQLGGVPIARPRRPRPVRRRARSTSSWWQRPPTSVAAVIACSRRPGVPGVPSSRGRRRGPPGLGTRWRSPRCPPTSTSSSCTTRPGRWPRPSSVDAVAAAVRAGAVAVGARAAARRHGQAGRPRRRRGRAATVAARRAAGDPDAAGLRPRRAGEGPRRGERDAVTDDAGAGRVARVPVVVRAGLADAFKVTGPRDLVVAEAILRERRR